MDGHQLCAKHTPAALSAAPVLRLCELEGCNSPPGHPGEVRCPDHINWADSAAEAANAGAVVGIYEQGGKIRVERRR
jgi:hypothetical protein